MIVDIIIREALINKMETKVVKGMLKFKNTGATNTKKTTVELPPKELKKEEHEEKPEQQETEQKVETRQEEERQYTGKTAAERAF